MKQSIKLHKECLENLEASINKQKEHVKNEIAHLNKKEKDYYFRQEQINEAEKRGILAYDLERFLVKRTKKELNK